MAREEDATPAASAKYKAIFSAVLLLFVLFPMAILSILDFRASKKEASIGLRERMTTGLITARRKEKNGISFDYKFKANGRDYEGHGYPSNTGLEVGQYATVYFDPSNASTNSLTEFQSLSANDRRVAVRFFFVSIGIGFTWLIYIRHGWRPTPKKTVNV